MAYKNNGPRDWMNEISRRKLILTGYQERFCIDDIVDNKDNFFNMDTNLCGLKDDICANGVSAPVKLKIEVTDGEVKYVLIEGHRRVLSCRQLVAEGHREFRYVRAIIEDNIDSVKEIERLIMSNTTQRPITPWEKCMAASMLRETYEKNGMQGVRDMVAEKLHLSTGQTSNYFYIGDHLSDGLMGVFRDDSVSMNLILDAAHLTESEQAQLADIVAEKGTFAKEDIDGIVSRRVIAGQQSLMGNLDDCGISDGVEEYDISVGSSDENLSPSDKSEEELAVDENLSLSDKSEKELTMDENLSLSDKCQQSFVDNVDNNNIVTDTVDNNNPVSGNEIADKETEAAVEDTKPKAADRYDTLSVVRKLIAQYNELVHRHTRSDKDFEIKCILDALVLYEAELGKNY